jgi:hypothetical protein
MIDIAVAYNRFRFLGLEFLTWLWFIVETDQNYLLQKHEGSNSINVGNFVTLENRHGGTIEIVSIRGDDAGLEEGRLALKKGAMVAEINLLLSCDNQNWQFTLKGESLNIGNLKIPETGPIDTRDDLEGAILEKCYLFDKVVQFVNLAFYDFINLRVSESWKKIQVPKIKKWIMA